MTEIRGKTAGEALLPQELVLISVSPKLPTFLVFMLKDLGAHGFTNCQGTAPFWHCAAVG